MLRRLWTAGSRLKSDVCEAAWLPQTPTSSTTTPASSHQSEPPPGSRSSQPAITRPISAASAPRRPSRSASRPAYGEASALAAATSPNRPISVDPYPYSCDSRNVSVVQNAPNAIPTSAPDTVIRRTGGWAAKSRGSEASVDRYEAAAAAGTRGKARLRTSMVSRVRTHEQPKTARQPTCSASAPE